MRARLAKGIAIKALKPEFGATTIGNEPTRLDTAPQEQRKTANEATTERSGASSHHALMAKFRYTNGSASVAAAQVIQMCRMTPGPSTSARTSSWPGASSTAAEPLRPTPRWDAA